MNYGSLTNEELLTFADRAPASILAARLAESIDTEWTEERCNKEWEEGHAAGMKESDDAHADLLASIASDLETIADKLDDEPFDKTSTEKLLQALIDRLNK